MNLRDAVSGESYTISHISGDNCELLRDYGFCEKMNVQKISDGRNCVCSICGVRVCLSKNLAKDVELKNYEEA